VECSGRGDPHPDIQLGVGKPDERVGQCAHRARDARVLDQLRQDPPRGVRASGKQETDADIRPLLRIRVTHQLSDRVDQRCALSELPGEDQRDTQAGSRLTA
jgi:hypothetical protein